MARSRLPRRAVTLSDELDDLLYAELKRVASRVARKRALNTLGTTGLLHEAWLRLRKASRLRVGSRQHFVALVIKAIREAAADAARRRGAQKRSASRTFDIDCDELPARHEPAELILTVNQGLAVLEAEDPQAARVLEARYFARMTTEEVASEFELSVRTVERSQAFGRAWMKRWMAKRDEHGHR
jgi:RNA polymerase sigma factor (TIGR02999 family)